MEAKAAKGLLREFNRAGVLELADVHVAKRLGTLGRESSEPVLLAAALAVRAVRLGSVCVELATMRNVLVEDVDVPALPWPSVAETVAALRVSPLVVGPTLGTLTPLRLVDDELLYLERYFLQEQTIRESLHLREQSAPPYDEARLATGLVEHFPAAAPDRQRLAAAVALTRWTSLVAGGPGTGKTYTVARVLKLLKAQDPGVRIALAAPTGKAAARLQEQVQSQGLTESAVTLHRLLGWRRGSSSRFRHDAGNRLPHDVVVVDETSMVSLTMMARLLEALRPDTRLVLVGDPDQLASVDAGAVLGDLVARPVTGVLDPALTRLVGADLLPGESAEALTERDVSQLRGGVVRLSYGHRYGGAIHDLAVAIRAGEPAPVLEVLRRRDPRVSFVEDGSLEAVRRDVVSTALSVTKAAEVGDVPAALAALEGHRLLCAHRVGPFGVQDWDRRAREWVQEELGERLDPFAGYPGQPLLVTANDYDAKVYNGDTGVVVAVDGQLRAAFPREGAPLLLPLSAVGAMRTVYAMTIHRSQGSQYRAVSVLLPDTGSALLTRELLYTAVTRAEEHVRVLGTQAAIETGVRQQVLRASGLRRV
jgi:exodeoxyribonuclease V alpha subunit